MMRQTCHRQYWAKWSAFFVCFRQTTFPTDMSLKSSQGLNINPRLLLPWFAQPVPSKPVKRWNFRKIKWSHYITLTSKLVRTLLPSHLPDKDQEYQCFCNAISNAVKKCNPCGRRNNCIPCWDVERENLYQNILAIP